MDASRPRGLYFEEFSQGQVITSPGRTITEADVVAFAGLSGDYNQLHTDEEFARGTPYGRRIAHGLLGLAAASGLAARAGFIEGTTQAFVGLTCKFKAPVFIGDTIHLRATVSKLRPMPSMGGGMVVCAMEVLNQRGEVVQEGEWTLLMQGQPTQVQPSSE